MDELKVPAASLAVISGGRVEWAKAYGYADKETGVKATPRTLFQAGSISKPVAATAVLRRVESGALRLDTDVNAYLKSWKVPPGPLTAADGRKVTLERLLSHTAGLTVHGFPGYAPDEPVPTVLQVLDGAAPANTEAVRVDLEPGTKFRYSGGGYTVAQLVMTDTLGRPFPDLMRELVLAPAGMSRSTYEQPLPPEKLRLAAAGYRRDGSAVPGKRHTYPEMAAAGLWTTAEDLARFAIAIGRSIRGDKGSLLSKEMAERMTTRVRKDADAGLGLFLSDHEGSTAFGHDGADEGFQALLISDRERGFGAAVMVNSDNGVQLGEEIIRGIAVENGWNYLPRPLEPVPLAPADLASLAGRYRLHGDEGLDLSVRGDRLLGGAGTPDEYELLPLSRELFARRDREIRYRAEWNGPGGSISGISILADGNTTPAPRVEEGVRFPSDFLAEGKIDEAVAAYRKLFSEKPADAGVAEGRLNNLGYRLAGEGPAGVPKAVAILKLNTELYPRSANASDSLSEVYVTGGDRARGLEAARKVLELLPADEKLDNATKERLRRIAEKRIRELSPEAPR